MTTFETLFGVKEGYVKNTCILMPLAPKGMLSSLGVNRLFKGKLYSSGNSKYFTVIHTGIGPALSGDCVLYLKKTQCKNIILFGSCGLVKENPDTGIGSLVMPLECFELESFSSMLLRNTKDMRSFYPDKWLFEKFTEVNKDCGIKKVTCATLGSLKLEEEYIDIFEEHDIHAVDMECSAFFSAASHSGIKAIALFYASDIINKKPFYKTMETADKLSLLSSIKKALSILCKFIEKNLGA